ncbi:hypothetical protein L1887_56409 [Cichorium endivia]|nr:hypothetical protein L1887_56409 [Cichorium endivia]
MTLELGSSWEFHKDTIRTLYIVRNEPLKDVIIHMREEHGFDKRYENKHLTFLLHRLQRYSKSQYENQLRKWGLRKNSKGSRWKDVHRKCQVREKQGKKNAVYKNGRRVEDDRLIKERRHDFRKLEEWCISGMARE